MSEKKEAISTFDQAVEQLRRMIEEAEAAAVKPDVNKRLRINPVSYLNVGLAQEEHNMMDELYVIAAEKTRTTRNRSEVSRALIRFAYQHKDEIEF